MLLLHVTILGAKEQHQRWLQCLRTVEDFFGMTIARKFVAEHFDEKSKEVVRF